MDAKAIRLEIERLKAENEKFTTRYANLKTFTKAKEYSREKLFTHLQILESTGKVEEMAEAIQELPKFVHGGLNLQERNILGVACKGLLKDKQIAWHKLDTTKENGSTKLEKECAKKYQQIAGKRIESICAYCQNLLDELLKVEQTDQGTVFLQKMKADYYNYLAECSESPEIAIESAKNCYDKAMEIAIARLNPTDVIRLSLAMNYATFMREVIKDKKSAAALADTTYSNAITHLDELPEDQYADVAMILHLIK